MTKPPPAANDTTRPGATPSALIRRGIVGLVILISLAAFGIAALPLVASTQLVRNRIAIELSSWSGFRVSIASTPQLELWPTFKAVLSGVTLYQWGDWENPAVIEAERVEIDLSAVDALSGNVSFSEVKLVNPVVRLGGEIMADGPEQFTSSGRIAQAVETVRGLIADDPENAQRERYPSSPLASLRIQNGRIVGMQDEKQVDIVTRLNGGVDWPALNDAGQASLSGVWRGEEVKLDFASDSPLSLLAGGESNVKLNLSSELVRAALEGQVRTGGGGKLQTHLTFEAPNVRQATAWAGVNLATGAALDSLSFAGDVTGGWSQIASSNAEMTINQQTGKGGLQLALSRNRPKLTGALSFAEIDLEAVASLLTPIWSRDFSSATPGRPLNEAIDADISISSAAAKLGTAVLTELAGSISADQQQKAFTISGSKGFGGSVTGSVALVQKLNRRTVELDLKAAGVNGKQLADAIGLGGLTPDAKGDIEIDVSGKGQALDQLAASASGTIKAHFGAGKIEGLDLPALIAKAATTGFFPAADVAQGALAIDSADLDIALDGGVTRIRQAAVKSGPKVISLSGIMPYAGRGVALSGAVTSTDMISIANPFGREATFFVGGSWDAPFVSAALPGQLPQ